MVSLNCIQFFSLRLQVFVVHAFSSQVGLRVISLFVFSQFLQHQASAILVIFQSLKINFYLSSDVLVFYKPGWGKNPFNVMNDECCWPRIRNRFDSSPKLCYSFFFKAIFGVIRPYFQDISKTRTVIYFLKGILNVSSSNAYLSEPFT